jgi:hydrogenase maturation protein HypF
VYGLARRHRLGGFVLNDGAGVIVEAEGAPRALEALGAALRAEAPALARVESVVVEQLPARGTREFTVAVSADGPGTAPVAADVATCDECLRELLDPADRRYRYPFVNCTNCGPRFTIVRAVPYDRSNTTMAGFEMCPDCRREFEDPGDRRFHAEAIACPACGPSLTMPLRDAVRLLRDGAVLAVKGLGGYHLACDAANERAVARLRSRKLREQKPFAVMTCDPVALCEVNAAEDALLRSPERPIVLLRRRRGSAVAASVAPGSRELGVMLPYTPLHHLLLSDFGAPLVLTSGNRSDEPIAFEDEDARSRLGDIADAFLAHDRPIHRRCEDSVIRERFPVRRSRGFAPNRLPLPRPAPVPLVGVGAELKNTFCIARGGEAHLSPHLGDLSNGAAFGSFRSDLDLYVKMLAVEPSAVAHDLHPDYLSTRWAHEQDAPLVGVQHHHAHAAACLSEHGRTGPALALVFDGTGYGPDGTIWGGELLRCDLERFDRVAHLEPVPLPGGAAAIREPWRTAAAYLERAGRPVPRRGVFARWPLVRQSLAVNAPRSSGMGRLFDAVAAVLGVCDAPTYEGQPAIELERLADLTTAAPYACGFRDGVICGADLVGAAYDDVAAGRARAEIAAAFHEGVAAVAARACAEAAWPGEVVLSGGSFQNLRLLGSVRRRLEGLGFRVLEHRRVPPNDGGISYGQVAVAAARLGAPPCA